MDRSSFLRHERWLTQPFPPSRTGVKAGASVLPAGREVSGTHFDSSCLNPYISSRHGSTGLVAERFCHKRSSVTRRFPSKPMSKDLAHEPCMYMFCASKICGPRPQSLPNPSSLLRAYRMPVEFGPQVRVQPVPQAHRCLTLKEKDS